MTDTPEPSDAGAGRHRLRLFIVLSCLTVVGLGGMFGLVSLMPTTITKPADTFLVMLSCPNSEPVYIKAQRDIRTTDFLLKSILPGNEPLASVASASTIDGPDVALIQSLAKSPFPGWTASLVKADADRPTMQDARATDRASIVRQMQNGSPIAVAKLRGQKTGTAGVVFAYSNFYGGRGGAGRQPNPANPFALGAPGPDYTPPGHMFASVEQFYILWNEAGRPPVYVFRDTKEYVGTYAVTGYTTSELADLDR